MLAILLTWLYIFFLSLLFGHLTIFSLQSILKHRIEEPPHVTLTVLAGLGTITCIAAIFSFFSRINWEIHVFLLIIEVMYGILNRKRVGKYIAYYRRAFQANKLFPILMLGMVLLLSLLATAMPPAYYDDGLYYLPFMDWINNYTAVPGLGNLHPRLAFNSNWHLLSAVFSFSFFEMGSFNDMNGFLHVLMALFGLSGLKALMEKNYMLSNVLRAALLIPTHLIVGYFNGPSADVPVIYMIWLIIILFIQKGEKGHLHTFDFNTIWIMLFSTWVCTIKLSAFPIVILAIYLLWQELSKKRMKQALVMMGIAMILALPWIGRNVVISGYVFFPFYQLDLVNVDWKIPAELVQEEVKYIEAFAAGESLVKKIPYPELGEMSFAAWFPQWFSDLRAANKGIFFLIFALTLGYFSYFFLNLLRGGISFIQKNKGFLLLFLSIYAGIAFWFLKAPDFRFGYAFTVILYLLSLSFLVKNLLGSYRYGKYAMLGFMGLIALFYLRPLQIIGTDFYYFTQAEDDLFLFSPGKAPELPIETYTTAEGLRIYKATNNDQCWGSPLPCTPFYDLGIRLRDEKAGLAKGFYHDKPDVAYYRELQIHYQQPDKVAKPTKKEETLNSDTTASTN